jgi:hypothetical protein
MNRIEEKYQRITDDKRLFDIRFWQSQGDQAIFKAVTEMLNDYLWLCPSFPNAIPYKNNRLTVGLMGSFIFP